MLNTKNTFTRLTAKTELSFYTEPENKPRKNYIYNKDIMIDQNIKKSLYKLF